MTILFGIILCLVIGAIIWMIQALNEEIKYLEQENEWLIEQIEYIKVRLGE